MYARKYARPDKYSPSETSKLNKYSPSETSNLNKYSPSETIRREPLLPVDLVGGPHDRGCGAVRAGNS